MAPSNEFLDNNDVVAQLTANNPKMVRYSAFWYDGASDEDKSPHRDFDRPTELPALVNFLATNPATTVPVTDIVAATYESAGVRIEADTEGYLPNRVRGHLAPGSRTLAKYWATNTAMNGDIWIIAADGENAIRVNRHDLATAFFQGQADDSDVRVVKRLSIEARKLNAARRKSLAMDPTSETDLNEIEARSRDNIRRQLGGGA